MRRTFTWKLGSRALQLGGRTLIMGVVNVTPDSFSDGGRYLTREHAVEHGLRLLEEGADILDIGGESTRPGASVDAGSSRRRRPHARPPAVSAEEEMSRVLPVIAYIKRERPDAVISVDTYKAVVARAAVQAGAEIVNDVSGFRWDPDMTGTLAQLRCGAVLMHMRGRPEEWRSLRPVSDIVGLVRHELRQWAAFAVRAGIDRRRIVLDPGLGFGKNFAQNYPLLARFEELAKLGFPLLVGASRKSFTGRLLARDGKDAGVDERRYASLAVETALILKGAHIVRTHEVRASRDAAQAADAILSATRK